MVREISSERTGLYKVGQFLQVVGGLGFFACFVMFAISGFQTVETFGKEGNPIAFWIGAVVCVAAIIAGGFARKVGARGVAGSGLVLDPEQAAEDMEPWARSAGRMVKDAADEAGIRTGGDKIMVRCTGCRTLNDEKAKFCDNCGKQL